MFDSPHQRRRVRVSTEKINMQDSLAALEAEGLSRDELLAGLERLGFERPGNVLLAMPEEAGHI